MKSKFLAAALLSSALVPAVFANSNAGSVLFVCATPQSADLLQADFEALTWVQVKSLGIMGETGSKTNLLNYDTWDTTVIQKSKGLTDAGSPTLEFARLPTDPGQVIMRNAAKTNLNYAFKLVRNDPISVGGIPTTIYNRGLITGPARPNGKNEDFDLEVYTIGLNQQEVVVNPTAGGVAPTLSVEPVISGSLAHPGPLTTTNGTWAGDATIVFAYQWYSAGTLIPGANAITYAPGVGDVGKLVSVRVTASNASGSGSGFATASGVIT